MAYDVFISHSSADKQTADAVCDFLETKGVQCWIAPRDILPGEEWGDSILRGINACRIMVLIFSRSANDSGPVRSEVDRAVNARKILIPFRIENVAPTGAMEFHIGRRHWLDAYTPPLRRHLDLLLRAVHDVLKPHEESATTAGAPSAGTDSSLPAAPTLIRPSATVLPPPAAQGDAPLRIFFNFNHVVITGYPSTFQVMVENRGAQALEQMEIIMESRGLEAAVSKGVAKLLPSQWQRQLFEIEPIRAGNFLLQVTIKCREESKQLAFVGSRALRINEAPKTSDLLSGLKDLQGNSDKPGGAPGSDASALRDLAAPGMIRSLNDLLNLELPENFEPLDLNLDYEVSMRALAHEEAGAHHRLQIPGAFLAQAQPGTLLKLEPVDAAAKGAPAEVRLVARPSFVLGRSRDEADFLLWFWPRNEVNDAKTRRMSKKHCVLTIRDAKLYVCPGESANLTAFNGQDLSHEKAEPLERRGILSLGGIYFLDVTLFSSGATEGPIITNLRSWPGPESPPAASPVGGSVRFLPMTSQALPQNSTWLLTDATFGTSRSNPIIIDSKGLAEIQGRFYHHLGAFWIESAVNNQAIHLNGTTVEPGYILPLVTGQLLRLGDKSYRVTVVP